MQHRKSVKRKDPGGRHSALYDPLTGLPSRPLFLEHLRQALARRARTRSEGHLAVALLDLDCFKDVNAMLGHATADRLLIAVAHRLRATLRQEGTVARPGGDRFLLLASALASPPDAAALARRALDTLRAPFRIDGHEVRIAGSLGMALAPGDGDDAATLVNHADLALCKAKEAGLGGWQLFDPALHTRAARVLDIRTRLAHAVESESLDLHYQPLVDLRTGRIVAVEALVRWEAGGENVSPEEFIPIAEQGALIGAIGDWVLRRACADAQAWTSRGLAPVRVAVNLSPRQFLQADVVHVVRTALARSGLAPGRLELEITEGVAMRDADVARRALVALRAEGVTVALDDFGTGYSSLDNLRIYPIDRLKIDRRFVSGDGAGMASAPLLAAMVALGHALGLEVVAEGVETAEQLALLRSTRCDLGQGYGLHRPVNREGIAALLAGKPALSLHPSLAVQTG